MLFPERNSTDKPGPITTFLREFLRERFGKTRVSSGSVPECFGFRSGLLRILFGTDSEILPRFFGSSSTFLRQRFGTYRTTPEEFLNKGWKKGEEFPDDLRRILKEFPKHCR